MAEMRTELQMIKMSEIQSQEVAWLWFPFIPYGKLTIVQGDPALKRRAIMIRQPEWGTRNVNKYFYESEARRIAELNEIFGDIELTEAEMRMLIWLAGWDEYTIENVLSAIRKAIAAEVKRRQQPPRP